MDQRRLKGVIFDFNGVIVDDYLLQKEVWDQVSVIVRGHPATDEEMAYKIRGIPTKDTIMWMSDGALNADQIDELTKRKAAIAKELFDSSDTLQLTPGLPRFLDEFVMQRVSRAIATSQTSETLSHLFDKLRLERWFDRRQVVYDDGTFPGKPAPDAYLRAAGLLKLDPAECVVIEDAQSGIQAAYAAGVRIIVAIGRDEKLEELQNLLGVVKGIHDFTELRASELFDDRTVSYEP